MYIYLEKMVLNLFFNNKKAVIKMVFKRCKEKYFIKTYGQIIRETD